MEKIEIDGLVMDFSENASSSADPELRCVEAALFVEECFGLSLTDADFSVEKIGDSGALRHFLFDRLGV